MSARLCFGGVVLVARGVARVGLGDAAGLAVERGREEQRLALARALGDEPVDGRAEAHVEHAVGLVEHERLHLVEPERPALEQVLEPPGGGHEDVGALRVAGLLLEADAAVDGGHAEVAGARQLAQLVDDLAGELARGGEDERRRASRIGRDAVDRAGTPKASVLPEPVGDLASTSRPASTSAMTSSWMGKGVWTPRSLQGGGYRTGNAEIGE